MKNDIDGLVQMWTMLLMLQKEVETGSKSLYPDAMEDSVRFQPNTITHFGDFIAQYQDWY